MNTADIIFSKIRSYRINGNKESDYHAGMKRILDVANIRYVHEYILSDKDRIDFYLPDFQIGIEIKIDGSVEQVNRQMRKYADSDDIRTLFLYTTRNRHINVAPELGGKPIYICINGAGVI